jgi:hypothetical protein
MGFAAAQSGPQATSNPAEQFTVVRTGHFIAGTESLTSADANCTVAGAGYGATMQCRAAGPTKGSYHYNTALVVRPDGLGYVIACRVPLILVLCKKLEIGTVVEGRMDKGVLAISDGDKIRRYWILTSANVGSLPVSEDPAAKSGTQTRPEPNPAAASEPPSGNPAGRAEKQSGEHPDDPFATCTSSTAACVVFTSEPQGADIYIDGKFVGNTPSMILLAAGSHILRIEAETFAPWSRTFEASAGNKVTIHATLQAGSPHN